MLNAGIALQQKPGEDGTPTWRELYHAHYDTNLFGTVVAIEAFLPLLRNSKAPEGVGKRIAITGSNVSSLKIARDTQGVLSAVGFPIYRSTKTALNMVMLHYARLLDAEGFVVSSSNPGYCATDINGHSGGKHAREGCKELIKPVVMKKNEVHGLVIDEFGILPW